MKLLVIMAGLVLTTQIQYFTSGSISFIILVLLLGSTQTSIKFALKWISSVMLLVTLIIVLNLLFSPIGTLWATLQISPFPPLIITFQGIDFGGVFLLRTSISLLYILILILTTPPNVLFQTLERLHISRNFITVTLLTYRYLILLTNETRIVTIAYSARHLQKITTYQRFQAIGLIIAQTLHRGLKRGTLIYYAMQARGFHRQFPSLWEFQVKRKDMAITCLFGCFILSVFILDLMNYTIPGIPLISSFPLKLTEWFMVFSEIIQILFWWV